MIKKDFVSEKINGEEYWISNSIQVPKTFKDSLFLLPAFDEFLISYKDRTASVITEHESKAFSKNGIFWPTILINGKVLGTWKRQIKKDKLSITIKLFDSKTKLKKTLLQKEAIKLGNFLNSKVEIILS